MEAMTQAAGQMAARLKTFEEMDDTQKIAYLHAEVKGLIERQRQLYARISALEGHNHGPNGQVMVPLNYANQAIGGSLGLAPYGY